MRNREYKRIGKRVGRAVRDAIRYGNFEDIGRAVGDGVQEITDDVNEVIGGYKNTRRYPPHPYSQNRPEEGGASEEGAPERDTAGGRPAADERPVCRKTAVRSAFRNRMPGSISGVIWAVVGPLIGIPFFIAGITCFAAGAVGLMPSPTATVVVSCVAPVVAAAVAVTVLGAAMCRRARRFSRYRDTIGPAAFCTVKELAEKAGETPERTKKDLRKMIASGACPQGHLDRGETCFMVDDETYGEYLEAEKAYAAREQAAKAEEQQSKDPKASELAAVKKEGYAYLEQIRAANSALPGEAISEKLARLEDIVTRIFTTVEQHPEKLPDIRHFMRYYLPTTLKLVKSYEEFESSTVQGTNIVNAKNEIEHALDTVNTAFGNLLDTLYADDALDVSADISTLETMLKQEGLSGSDFSGQTEDGRHS